jgi:3-oxoacyl-[acyl-carrier protein] reductase
MRSVTELKGKNCVIFGADSSFGRGLSRHLAGIGLNLGLIDLTPKNSGDLVKNLGKAGVKLINLVVASGDLESFEKAVKRVKEYLGSIEYLICSYYFEDDENKDELDVEKLSMDKWDNIFRGWVESYFLMAKAVLPHMLNEKRGKIIFVNTTSGYTGEGEGEGQLTEEGSIYYSTCSSAITGLMTSMARDIIPLGIEVNGIALAPSHGEDEDRILNTVVFLLSDLSYYTCGQIIRLY